ncbi:hypothetical protein [Actinomadura alba]|uniref:hypothetical protein n=1 Tax=Actinomadura alba TaxID=406431 RepID=UPI001650A163|nr:hypothetical protein [Actinomadura alba]
MDALASVTRPNWRVSASRPRSSYPGAFTSGTIHFANGGPPADDGSQEVSDVADRVRADSLRRIGLADLLTPART